MKRILYASGGFTTDDAVADALMEYASVLAIVESSDVVDCEGLDGDGRVRRIRLLLGPASQILAMDTGDPETTMNVDGIVAELQRRSRSRLPDSSLVGDASDLVAETDADSVSHEESRRS